MRRALPGSQKSLLLSVLFKGDKEVEQANDIDCTKNLNRFSVTCLLHACNVDSDTKVQ